MHEEEREERDSRQGGQHRKMMSKQKPAEAMSKC